MKRFPSFAKGSSQVEMSRRIAGTVVLRYAAASWMVIPRDCIWCGLKTRRDDTIRTAPWQVRIGEGQTSPEMAHIATFGVSFRRDCNRTNGTQFTFVLQICNAENHRTVAAFQVCRA